MLANVARDLAQDRWRRCEGRAGTDEDSHSSTTLDIYQQFVPESRQRAVDKLSGLAPIGTNRATSCRLAMTEWHPESERINSEQITQQFISESATAGDVWHSCQRRSTSTSAAGKSLMNSTPMPAHKAQSSRHKDDCLGPDSGAADGQPFKRSLGLGFQFRQCILDAGRQGRAGSLSQELAVFLPCALVLPSVGEDLGGDQVGDGKLLVVRQ